MKARKIILSMFILMLAFTTCTKDDDTDPIISGPEVQWISGGTTTTYTYSSGVISGYNFYRSFNVLSESGEITIDVQVMGDSDSKVSHKFTVEKGMEYSLKVHASRDGTEVSSPGAKCLTVVFSSPYSSSDQEISVNSYLVSAGGFDTYYCPVSFNFGEIEMVE